MSPAPRSDSHRSSRRVVGAWTLATVLLATACHGAPTAPVPPVETSTSGERAPGIRPRDRARAGTGTVREAKREHVPLADRPISAAPVAQPLAHRFAQPAA